MDIPKAKVFQGLDFAVVLQHVTTTTFWTLIYMKKSYNWHLQRMCVFAVSGYMLSGYLFEQDMHKTVLLPNFRQLLLILQPSVVCPILSLLVWLQAVGIFSVD